MPRAIAIAAAAAFTALAPAAHAQGLTVGDVFADASFVSKAFMLGLLALAVAAVTVCIRKLAAGPNLAGGSAYLSGLRLGAPLIGFLGAAYVLLMIFMAVANTDYAVTLKIAAPGIAEAVFILALGLLTGVVAVVAHWAVEARIDRTVLKH